MLVSLLEPDSELYNTGIVDVSHRYPKMYVIRPQFFIPIITLLRNAAMNSLKYKSELAQVKAQNIDITNFESSSRFQDRIRAQLATWPPGSRRRSSASTKRSTTWRRRKRLCTSRPTICALRTTRQKT